MSKKFELAPEAFQFEGKMSLKEAIPLGMQHVLAMFVGNLTPLLIITGIIASECDADRRYRYSDSVV